MRYFLKNKKKKGKKHPTDCSIPIQRIPSEGVSFALDMLLKYNITSLLPLLFLLLVHHEHS